MSEWQIETVKFELFNPARGERVVVQKHNGGLDVTTKEPAEPKKGEAASKSRRREDDEKPAEAKPRKREDDEKPAEEKPAEVKAKTTARRKGPKKGVKADTPSGGTLKWRPIVDAGYDGYAAHSHGAEIQTLKTTAGRWAMYVFWEKGVMKHMQCFVSLEDAKVAGQKLHDTGLPPRPDGKLTQDMIDKACPAPSAPRPPRRAKSKEEPPKTEQPAEPAPTPAPAAPTLTPELRNELRSSLTDAIKEGMSQLDDA